MTILNSFPYPTPRQGQAEILSEIERLYHRYDIFVIVAPTAAGKSAIMKTLMGWKHGVTAITPTNLLVSQFLEEFPDTHTLQRLDKYHCEDWNRSCATTRAKCGGFCKGCPAAKDLVQAKYKNGPGIYNYHIMQAHQIHRPLLIVDEAHNLSRVIQDKLSTHIWQHDYRYPDSMHNIEDIRKWLEKLPPNKKKHKKIALLSEIVNAEAPKYVVERSTEMFNGKGTARGIPEERDCLKFYPVDISEAPPFFWPRETEKIVLLSATIGHVDIRELGLEDRRVVYMQAASPIPARQRPVQFVPVVDLNHGNMEASLPRLAEEIDNIANYHFGEKGLVHVTYGMAEMLRRHLPHNDRYVFHDRDNKTEMYEYFRDSKEPLVLFACGMYEGIDLPDDLGRWQIIAKTPFKSLGDPAIAYKAERDQDWYSWSALKDLIQGCGRVCRHEKDMGITYLLDSSSARLIQNNSHLIPQWFRDALDAGNQ